MVGGAPHVGEGRKRVAVEHRADQMNYAAWTNLIQ
jgi:hypothetical protein